MLSMTAQKRHGMKLRLGQLDDQRSQIILQIGSILLLDYRNRFRLPFIEDAQSQVSVSDLETVIFSDLHADLLDSDLLGFLGSFEVQSRINEFITKISIAVGLVLR